MSKMTEEDPEPSIINASSIKDVWDGNLEEEIENISNLIEKYNYLAMDTEFPGFCINNNSDQNAKDGAFKFIKNNVDALCHLIK